MSIDASETVGNSLIELIARAASDPAIDLQKMQQLLEMQERIMAKRAEVAFNEAVACVNEVDLRVAKNGTASLGGKGNYRFAKWEDMDAVIRPLLRDNGLRLSFDTELRPEGGVFVHGWLTHRDGHKIKASILLPVDTGPGRNPLQQMGSTTAYGKRYVTEMLLNIVREDADDDGRAGGTAYARQDQRYANNVRQDLQQARPHDDPPSEPKPETLADMCAASLRGEKNPTKWLNLLQGYIASAADMHELGAIRGLPMVRKAERDAPQMIRAIIREVFQKAADRIFDSGRAEAAAEPSDDDVFPGDLPITTEATEKESA